MNANPNPAGRTPRRTRILLLSVLAVVAVGVAAALGALWLAPARAAVGPLPDHALLLPADARFVVGLDVRRFTASGFYTRYAKQAGLRPEALRELEEKAGLDPARDLDHVVVAGGADPKSTLALVTGRFDLARLASSLETEKGVKPTVDGGVKLYILEGAGGSGAASGSAIALLDAGAVLVGTKDRVQSAVASHGRRETPLRGNAALLGLVEKVRPGSTFWMVGDQSLLASVSGAASSGRETGAGQGAPSGPASGLSMLNLPALRSLTVVGDLDPQLSLSLTGETADEAAARNLADLVRGLLAMAALQAQQKPELQQLASAFSVTNEANRVLVSARIPYELLDGLQASLKPGASRSVPAEAPPAGKGSPR